METIGTTVARRRTPEQSVACDSITQTPRSAPNMNRRVRRSRPRDLLVVDLLARVLVVSATGAVACSGGGESVPDGGAGAAAAGSGETAGGPKAGAAGAGGPFIVCASGPPVECLCALVPNGPPEKCVVGSGGASGVAGSSGGEGDAGAPGVSGSGGTSGPTGAAACPPKIYGTGNSPEDCVSYCSVGHLYTSDTGQCCYVVKSLGVCGRPLAVGGWLSVAGAVSRGDWS